MMNGNMNMNMNIPLFVRGEEVITENIQQGHHQHLRRSSKTDRVRRSMQTTTNTVNAKNLEMTTTETENENSGNGSSRDLKYAKGYNYGRSYGNSYSNSYGNNNSNSYGSSFGNFFGNNYGNSNTYGNRYGNSNIFGNNFGNSGYLYKNEKAAKIGKSAKEQKTSPIFFVTPSATLVTPTTEKAWKATKKGKAPKGVPPKGVPPKMIAPIFPGPKTKSNKYHKSRKTAQPIPVPSPTPAPAPVLSSTNADVNVAPDKDNGEIEQELLEETVQILKGTRRLGTIVSLREEHEDDQEHRKLIKTQTVTVSTGTATIRVEFIGKIPCVDMFGDIAEQEGTECRDFSISITLTGGDQEDVNNLIETVEVSINTGTFTKDLGYCTVLIKDQVDALCNVVTASPTLAPTNAPTNVPSSSPSGSFYPSSAPSENPTDSVYPSSAPSENPTDSAYPSSTPSENPTAAAIESTVVNVAIPNDANPNDLEDEILGEVLKALDGDLRTLMIATDETGDRTIDVTLGDTIDCTEVFVDIEPPSDSLACYYFDIVIAMKGGTKQEIDNLIDEVLSSIVDGTFTQDLDFCTVTEAGTSDPACEVNLAPSDAPTNAPTNAPTDSPTDTPTSAPSPSTSTSNRPSISTSVSPSAGPSTNPSTSQITSPSAFPSTGRSTEPSNTSSTRPSAVSSSDPSAEPSTEPSSVPSLGLSSSPSVNPSDTPSSSLEPSVSAGPTRGETSDSPSGT
eukprot:CAMPEP_0170861424 /NCGR_PEP_ID=MMETSP0734-20130129/18205_1 /TAXON_ID=186038 /ORGANISM="Fragilariopsis kerguelensis, Strain L26-C5" /LENGTH=731 /DNA_ID=CAMNT_0011235501 /DNA_START=55 /DNA_END=2247 /DNA_ORIENTATION=+